jgi:hypothetical protein
MRTFAVIALLIASAGGVAHADSKAWTSAKAVFPSGEEIVGGANMATLRASKLYQTLLPMAMMNASDAKDQLDQIKKDCGIDMLTAIDSVAFALDSGQRGGVVVALKGTTRKDLEACAQKRAKADNKTLTITAGSITKYSGFTDKDLYLAWLGPDVVAISTSPDDKEATAKLVAGKGALAKDPGMKGPLGRVNTSATVWLVSSKALDISSTDAVPVAVHAKQTYGSANVTKDNIDLNVHAIMDAKTAKDFTTSANVFVDGMKKSGKVPPAFESLLKTGKLTAVGDEAVVTASVAQDDVFGMLGMLMGR